MHLQKSHYDVYGLFRINDINLKSVFILYILTTTYNDYFCKKKNNKINVKFSMVTFEMFIQNKSIICCDFFFIKERRVINITLSIQYHIAMNLINSKGNVS